MQFATFDTWQRLKIDDLAESNPLMNCPTCDAEGVIYEECCECGHETEKDCGTCDGKGQLHYNGLDKSDWLRAGLFTWQQYFRELIQTARDAAEFYTLDFLDIAGQAIKASQRAQH